jgi:hypothetical protein
MSHISIQKRRLQEETPKMVAKTAKIKMWLRVENNNKEVRKKYNESIEQFLKGSKALGENSRGLLNARSESDVSSRFIDNPRLKMCCQLRPISGLMQKLEQGQGTHNNSLGGEYVWTCWTF